MNQIPTTSIQSEAGGASGHSPAQQTGLSIQSAQGGCLIAAVCSSLFTLTAKASDPLKYQQVAYGKS